MSTPAPSSSAPRPGRLTAKTVKVTLVVNTTSFLALSVPPGTSHIDVAVGVDSTNLQLRARLTAKTVRRAQAAIRTHGADSVVCLLAGKLGMDYVVAEAGITAQPRQEKTG